MRFQIDTIAKTIKLEQSSRIGELLDLLEKMIPNDWREYSLETNVVINWNYPVIYHHQPYIWRYDQPNWKWPEITYSSGIYNVESSGNNVKCYAIN